MFNLTSSASLRRALPCHASPVHLLKTSRTRTSPDRSLLQLVHPLRPNDSTSKSCARTLIWPSLRVIDNSSVQTHHASMALDWTHSKKWLPKTLRSSRGRHLKLRMCDNRTIRTIGLLPREKIVTNESLSMPSMLLNYPNRIQVMRLPPNSRIGSRITICRSSRKLFHQLLWAIQFLHRAGLGARSKSGSARSLHPRLQLKSPT